jgi:hypothetical protein
MSRSRSARSDWRVAAGVLDPVVELASQPFVVPHDDIEALVSGQIEVPVIRHDDAAHRNPMLREGVDNVTALGETDGRQVIPSEGRGDEPDRHSSKPYDKINASTGQGAGGEMRSRMNEGTANSCAAPASWEARRRMIWPTVTVKKASIWIS